MRSSSRFICCGVLRSCLDGTTWRAAARLFGRRERKHAHHKRQPGMHQSLRARAPTAGAVPSGFQDTAATLRTAAAVSRHKRQGQQPRSTARPAMVQRTVISRPPQTRPSSAFMASSASRSSTNSMKPKPRGRLPVRSKHRVRVSCRGARGVSCRPPQACLRSDAAAPHQALCAACVGPLLMAHHRCFLEGQILEGQAAAVLHSRGTRPGRSRAQEPASARRACQSHTGGACAAARPGGRATATCQLGPGLVPTRPGLLRWGLAGTAGALGRAPGSAWARPWPVS